MSSFNRPLGPRAHPKPLHPPPTNSEMPARPADEAPNAVEEEEGGAGTAVKLVGGSTVPAEE